MDISASARMLEAVTSWNMDGLCAAFAASADPDTLEGEGLVRSAGGNKVDFVDAFLKKGANVHAGNDEALRRAASEGHQAAVTRLLEGGADPFARGGNALALARIFGHEAVAEEIEKNMAAQRQAFAQDMGAVADVRLFLTSPWRRTGEPGLLRAIRMGMLDGVEKDLRRAGQSLGAEDIFSLSSRDGLPAALVALQDGQMNALFSPGLWRGKFREARAAWAKVQRKWRHEADRAGVDFGGLLAGHRHEVLRQTAPKFRFPVKA